jgi:hypothetical protein
MSASLNQPFFQQISMFYPMVQVSDTEPEQRPGQGAVSPVTHPQFQRQPWMGPLFVQQPDDVGPFKEDHPADRQRPNTSDDEAVDCMRPGVAKARSHRTPRIDG